MPRRSLVVLLMAATVGGGLATGAPAAVDRVIHSDRKLSTFDVKADGTLRGAVHALGKTSSRNRNGEVCTVRWARLGIRSIFYNLGGFNPCRSKYGFFHDARIRGSGWHTGRGLAIGDRQRRLERLYPKATLHKKHNWWLVRRRSLFGNGGHYPGLAAVVKHRHVVRFFLQFPAGGD